MNISNSSIFYIYYSEFVDQAQHLGIDLGIAEILRNYVRENISRTQQYRAAVDDIISNNSVSSEPAFNSFAETSRVNHGNVLGQQVSAPEIAAILCKSGEQDVTTRSVFTYLKDSPDSQPRFLPLWSPAHESLQYPLLFMHGETGWSPDNALENPPKKS